LRIRLTLDIERSRPPEPNEREVDVYSSASIRDQPDYIGFTREEPNDQRKTK